MQTFRVAFYLVFVFLEAIWCQPVHLENLSLDTTTNSRLSGRRRYAPGMNPCRQDIRSRIGQPKKEHGLTG
jgi:hypothetical protein